MSSPASTSAPNAIQDSAWSAVFAMALCVFALIASEFMPVSLLTPIAADMRVSEGLVGYGIAISGAFAVMTSLSMSRLAGAMDRRTVLLILTALMGISGLVIGLASSYVMYMAGRALIGVVVGGFWSLSAAVAMRLVPSRDVPKALAIFNGGNALATVVAAPLGSYLGSVLGWRGAFLCLAPLALVALAWQWLTLPSLKSATTVVRQRNPLVLLRERVVLAGMAAVGLFFMGQFMLFTYVRPFLEGVTLLDASGVSMALLVIGVAGFVGTSLIGRFLKRGSIYRTLAVIPVVMAVIALALIAAGASPLATAALLGLWGLVATAAPVGWWSWLAKTLPGDAETGGGLMVATVQLSIALGSALGGLLFDAGGYRATFASSAGLLIIAAVLVVATAHAQRTHKELHA
jgi:predicted MFS family arabinose efflux permease